MRTDHRQRDLHNRIWSRLCDSFLTNEPFSLDEARAACVRPVNDQRATSGHTQAVNDRIITVIDSVIAQGNDQIRRLDDGRFVLPSRRTA